jgi:dTDP-4-amino-4,6-dideoxygalactose transaminase
VRTVALNDGTTSAHHQNVVRVPQRDRVREALARQGIETGVHYPIPCHRQGPYQAFADGPLPEVEWAASEILSLPLFPHITDRQIEHVSSRLNDAVGALSVDH